jgi:hypothetical protein
MPRRRTSTRLTTRAIGALLSIEYARDGKTYRHTFKKPPPLVFVPALAVLAAPARITKHRRPFIA